MNGIIYNVRPHDEGRLEKEMRVYDILEKLDISFTRIDHEAIMSVEDSKEIEEALNIKACKNLFLCDSKKDRFYLLIVIGDKRFESRKVSKQIGSSRLSFASGEYMRKFLNITPGSVSVLGLMNDIHNNVQLLVDKDIMNCEYIGCHPCINTSSLKIKTEDLLNKFLPYVDHDVIFVSA